jgi:hypothetical protein
LSFLAGISATWQHWVHCPEDLPAGPVRVCVYGVCSCCRACVTSYHVAV